MAATHITPRNSTPDSKLPSARHQKAPTVRAQVEEAVRGAFAADGYDRASTGERAGQVAANLDAMVRDGLLYARLTPTVAGVLQGVSAALGNGFLSPGVIASLDKAQASKLTREVMRVVSIAETKANANRATADRSHRTTATKNVLGRVDLRDGQIIADAVSEAISGTARARIIEAPTGVGKTTMATLHLERLAAKNDMRRLADADDDKSILLIVPRDELVKWNRELRTAERGLGIRDEDLYVGVLSNMERQVAACERAGKGRPKLFVTSYDSVRGMHTHGRLNEVLGKLGISDIAADEVHEGFKDRSSTTHAAIAHLASGVKAGTYESFVGYTATLPGEMATTAQQVGFARAVSLSPTGQILRGDQAPYLIVPAVYSPTGRETEVDAVIRGGDGQPGLNALAFELLHSVEPAAYKKLAESFLHAPQKYEALELQLTDGLGVYRSASAADRKARIRKRIEAIASDGKVTLRDLDLVCAIQAVEGWSDREFVTANSGKASEADAILQQARSLKRGLAAPLAQTPFAHLASAPESLGTKAPAKVGRGRNASRQCVEASSHSLSGLVRGLSAWGRTRGEDRIRAADQARRSFVSAMTRLGAIRRNRPFSWMEIAKPVDFPKDEQAAIDPLGTANAFLARLENGTPRAMMWTDSALTVPAGAVWKTANKTARIALRNAGRELADQLATSMQDIDDIPAKRLPAIARAARRATSRFLSEQLEAPVSEAELASRSFGEKQPKAALLAEFDKVLPESELAAVVEKLENDSSCKAVARDLFVALQVAKGMANPRLLGAESPSTSSTHAIAVVEFPSGTEFESRVTRAFAGLRDELLHDPKARIDCLVSNLRQGFNWPECQMIVDHDPAFHRPHLTVQTIGRATRSPENWSQEYSNLLGEVTGRPAMKGTDFPDLPAADRALLLSDPKAFLETKGIAKVDPERFERAIKGFEPAKKLTEEAHATLTRIAGAGLGGGAPVIPRRVLRTGQVRDKDRDAVVSAIFAVQNYVPAYLPLLAEGKGYARKTPTGTHEAGVKLERAAEALQFPGTDGKLTGDAKKLSFFDGDAGRRAQNNAWRVGILGAPNAFIDEALSQT